MIICKIIGRLRSHFNAGKSLSTAVESGGGSKPRNGWVVGAEHGLTLIEMLVAMVIAGILGTAILRVFNANNYLFRGEKVATATYVNSQNAFKELTKNIRMVNLNPQETGGGVFGLQSCNGCPGAVGTMVNNAAISANAVSSIFFTRDFNINSGGNTIENGILDNDSNERVGYYLNTATTGACPDANLGAAACPNTLMMAVIDPGTGSITGWQYKFKNVTMFQVDYQFTNGQWASSGTSTQSPFFGQCNFNTFSGACVTTFNTFVNPPDGNTITNYSFKNVAAIAVALTVRSAKPHDLTSQYIYETMISTIRLRNAYFN